MFRHACRDTVMLAVWLGVALVVAVVVGFVFAN